MMNENITCTITKEIGVISKNERGYTKEVNLVDWNNSGEKLDIRNWHPNREKSGKGITLTLNEGRMLRKILDDFYDKVDSDGEASQ